MKSYIYLTSFQYSGSTLLSFLLDSHPEIVSNGELRGPNPGLDMGTYLCSCGTRMIDCNFWLEVREQMIKRNFPFEFDCFRTQCYPVLHASLSISDKAFLYSFNSKLLNVLKDVFFRLDRSRTKYIEETNVRVIAMAEIITRLQNAEHYLDASKGSSTLKFLAKIKNADYKVILLIRDARSVIHSFLNRKTKMSVTNAAKIWLHDMKRKEAVIKSYVKPEKLIRIKYEDLCQNSQETLETIYRFIGVSNHPLTLPLKAENHHILGNKMRLGTIQEIKLDEKWKTALSEKEKAVIDAVAGNLNKFYGYT